MRIVKTQVKTYNYKIVANRIFFIYNRVAMIKILTKLFSPAASKTTAGALAAKFGLELRGDANAPVRGVAPIADARPGQLAFYSTEQKKLSAAENIHTGACCGVLPREAYL